MDHNIYHARNGTRRHFNRYQELGQYAFGDKLGLWIVVPQQLIVEVGVDIVYMVTGENSLQKFHDLLRPHVKIRTTYFIMIFASAHFVLSHLRNLNAISGVSLAAKSKTNWIYCCSLWAKQLCSTKS
ncbi:hypothetical protein Droror1_Dr00009557 [Drosera rotundifolia]